MHNLHQPIKTITDLCKIFPDIDGELCSRHTRLFGKLKTQFMKLYDSLQPTHYIVIKGSTVFFGQCTEAKMSMALQNGIIILVRQTNKNTKIFINGNHLDEELIYSQDGKNYEGMHPQASNIAKCIQIANQNLLLDQLYGGIFYIHANIPQQTFCYNESMLIGMFISFLIINLNVQNIITQQVMQKLQKCNEKLTKNFTMRYFKYYAPRSFCLQVSDKNLAVKLDPKVKSIICKIQVAADDLDYEREKRNLLKQHRIEMMRKLQSKYNISSVFELFTSGNISKIVLDELKSESNKEQSVLTFQNHLQWQLQQMKMLCQFSNSNLSFGQLIDMKWKLDSQYWQVYSEEIVELVEQIKKDLQLQHCMIIDSKFLLISTDKAKFTQLLIKIRRKIHKGEMRSKSLFKIEEQLVQNRFKQDVQIGQKLFTSAPSEGVAIFDPSQSIWFDDD